MEIKNLQIFADNPTVNVTTDGGLSAENKTFYDRALVEEAGGNIVGRMAILAEGDAQARKDIIYLEKLPLFNADGTVKG